MCTSTAIALTPISSTLVIAVVIVITGIWIVALTTFTITCNVTIIIACKSIILVIKSMLSLPLVLLALLLGPWLSLFY